MATKLYTECITCGHSIPLGDTYCGEKKGLEECLNRYAEDNEHSDYSYAQFLSWQQAGGLPVELDYHDWAVAHRELDELQENDSIDRHDQDDINALREQLFFEPRPVAEAPQRYTEDSEHPTYSHFDWRQAVAERSTEQGYHDWAAGLAEAEWPGLETAGEPVQEPLTAKEAEIEIVGALLYAILKAGYAITIDDTTPEYEVTKSRDWHKIFWALVATGEDELRLYRGGSEDSAGWIQLVYGNEGYTVIADYSDNEAMRAIVEEVQPVADYCEARCNGEQGALRPALAKFGPAELDALMAVSA